MQTFLCGHRVIPNFRHIFFTTVGHKCNLLAASSIGRWKYCLKSSSVNLPALSLCMNPQPHKNYSISTNKQYKDLIVFIYPFIAMRMQDAFIVDEDSN
jgi:hypothetical protein